MAPQTTKITQTYEAVEKKILKNIVNETGRDKIRNQRIRVESDEELITG